MFAPSVFSVLKSNFELTDATSGGGKNLLSADLGLQIFTRGYVPILTFTYVGTSAEEAHELKSLSLSQLEWCILRSFAETIEKYFSGSVAAAATGSGAVTIFETGEFSAQLISDTGNTFKYLRLKKPHGMQEINLTYGWWKMVDEYRDIFGIKFKFLNKYGLYAHLIHGQLLDYYCTTLQNISVENLSIEMLNNAHTLPFLTNSNDASVNATIAGWNLDLLVCLQLEMEIRNISRPVLFSQLLHVKKYYSKFLFLNENVSQFGIFGFFT
jgi:hypothetical protein